MHKSHFILMVFALFIAVFCLASCDNYNIVEPRFYSEKDIVDVPTCGEDEDGGDGTGNNQNCVDWPTYRVKTCLETDRDSYGSGDTVYMKYSIINLDTLILHYEMGDTPAVNFEVEEVGWFYPTVVVPHIWELVLEPGESYAESTFWDIKDTAGTMAGEEHYHLHGFLASCVSPNFSFPMDLEFSISSGVHEDSTVTLPSSFSLDLCWESRSQKMLKIQYSLPKRTEVRLSILGSGGNVVRSLVGANLKAGNYSVVWDGRDEEGREVEGGIYGVSLKADDFNKVIWFEID